MEGKIGILSQNYRAISINNPILLDQLKNEQIILGQEISTPKEANVRFKIIESIEKQFNYKIFVSPKINRTNLITFIPDKYKNDVKKIEMFCEGRALLTSLKLKNQTIDLANTYGPARNCAQTYQKFSEEYFNRIKTLEKHYLIGDWNILLKDNMCSQIRSRNHIYKSIRVAQHFENYCDIHEHLETKLNYTYHINTYKARLDRIYTKESCVINILNYQIIPNAFSDHDTIKLTIKTNERIIWGKSKWALNCTLLEDKYFEQEVNNLFHIYKTNKYFSNDINVRDKFKSEIKKQPLPAIYN